jgi:hypothetical protein
MRTASSSAAATVLHTGVATILVDVASGVNQIIVTSGANLDLEPSHVRQALESLLSPSTQMPRQTAAIHNKVLLVSLEIRMATAQQALVVGHALGATTILGARGAMIVHCRGSQ